MFSTRTLLGLVFGSFGLLKCVSGANKTTLAGVDLNKIEIKGYKFFDSVTGKYFPVKGIDYYPRPNAGLLNQNNVDFFTEKYASIWSRDIPMIAKTGANAIRLYAVDPTKNHDAFMCALSAAGIYVLIDLASSCLNCAITNDLAPACYPGTLKTRGQMIISEFSKYSNVLAFSAGNEVNHIAGAGKSASTAPCQKRFIKDMRQFVKSCPSMRQIPVGVVSADSDRDENAQYYNCRTNPDDLMENAEWFGLNVYQHCDGTVKEYANSGGFKKITADLASYKYSIPVMLTEYGCVSPSFPTVDGYEGQRTFDQSEWMFSKNMRDQVAGGFVFEYSTELQNSQSTSPFPFTKYGPQNYGLGYLTPEDCDEITKPCQYKKMPNYDSLAKKYTEVAHDEAELLMDKFTPDETRTKPTTCPAGFAKLSAFTWASDSIKNVACPATAYSCSGKTIVLNSADGGNEATVANSSSSSTTPSDKKASTESADHGLSPSILTCFVALLAALAL